MRTRFAPVVACATVMTFVAACESKPTSEQPVAEQPTAEVAAPAAPAGKSHPDCFGPVATGTPEVIKLGDAEWERSGSTLKLKSAPKNLAIGAVSDIKEDSPENLANLEALVKWFKKEKVDLIVVAGDTGLNREQIEKAIEILAKSGKPVFNIVGNREGKTDYKKAMANLVKKHPNVFDLNQIRRVDTTVVDLVSVPGYYNPSYIHSDDGCTYFAADLAATADLLKDCDSPTVLISHGGPKQTGPEGIDRTAEGENVGDPELTKLIKNGKVPFGIFGNIHEAGGRATDVDGTKILPPDKPHDSLYLNPGPADGIRWVMNDKSESVGMAGIMSFENGKASYKINRLEPPKN